MKICACIAEYNPLHLGHVKHLDYIRRDLNAEKVVVLLSGDFTQRGEPAVLDKFTRATQAINAGADVVIELPTVFATANAEIFSTGAVNILSALNCLDGLCFGVESGSKDEYLSLAKALADESKEFKKALKAELEKGVSLAKAKFMAVNALGKEFDQSLIGSPNNILGLEYTKAILKNNAQNDISIYPMKREGDHNDVNLKKGITSATSIREVIKSGKIKKLKKSLPPYVYKDLTEYPSLFDKMIMSKLLLTSAEELEKVLDCTEGLNNRIKALSVENRSIDELISRVATKRYPQTRIRRILTSNFLGIKKEFVTDCINSNLYAKVLAVKKSSKDIIGILSEKSRIPIITRKSDADKLNGVAKECYELDTTVNNVYNLVANRKDNQNQMIIV